MGVNIQEFLFIEGGGGGGGGNCLQMYASGKVHHRSGYIEFPLHI